MMGSSPVQGFSQFASSIINRQLWPLTITPRLRTFEDRRTASAHQLDISSPGVWARTVATTAGQHRNWQRVRGGLLSGSGPGGSGTEKALCTRIRGCRIPIGIYPGMIFAPTHRNLFVIFGLY